MSQIPTMPPVSPVEPVVSLVDVRKSFGPNLVLDGVSFAVARGGVTVIVGRSGSGKSTADRKSVV